MPVSVPSLPLPFRETLLPPWMADRALLGIGHLGKRSFLFFALDRNFSQLACKIKGYGTKGQGGLHYGRHQGNWLWDCRKPVETGHARGHQWPVPSRGGRGRGGPQYLWGGHAPGVQRRQGQG